MLTKTTCYFSQMKHYTKMKALLFLFLSFNLFLGCSQTKNETFHFDYKGTTYANFLVGTESKLNAIRKVYKTANAAKKDSCYVAAGKLLEESMTKGSFHYWLGTEWDFNGTTDIPKKGEIACGYFVSTTLKHLGFNLNRYKLAQKGSYDEEVYLCGKETIHTLRNKTQQDLKTYFEDHLEQGLYMIGLANHVGYLFYDGKELYFIHSNYGSPDCVVIEPFISSEVSNSDIFCVAPLSNNKELMRKWIENEFIPVP